MEMVMQQYKLEEFTERLHRYRIHQQNRENPSCEPCRWMSAKLELLQSNMKALLRFRRNDDDVIRWEEHILEVLAEPDDDVAEPVVAPPSNNNHKRKMENKEEDAAAPSQKVPRTGLLLDEPEPEPEQKGVAEPMEPPKEPRMIDLCSDALDTMIREQERVMAEMSGGEQWSTENGAATTAEHNADDDDDIEEQRDEKKCDF